MLLSTLAFFGCAKKTTTVYTSPGIDSPLQITYSSDEAAPAHAAIQVSNTLPIDSEARSLGTKVFAKGLARLFRSPRDNAPEYYRVASGTPMYVSRTSDDRWLQVRLSKGRSAYVKTSETNAALALALAQQRINDKARLTPKPAPGSEPDVGDGKASAGPRANPEVDSAIERLDSALSMSEDDHNALRAAISQFQGGQEDWVGAKAATTQELTNLRDSFDQVQNQIQHLTSLSSSFTSDERTGLNILVVAEQDAMASLNAIGQTLTSMVEGEDWTDEIANLESEIQELNAAMENLRAGIARLRGG